MSGDGFLSRWSRRKREEARAADAAPPPEEEAAAPEPALDAAPLDSPAPAAEAQETLTEEELAALPPIETIDATTDISGYLRKGVPAALKNAALRRVWAATPQIRDYLDPAREYAYDWNIPGGVPGDGPLGPDFDAKALADRLFSRRETKVEDPGDRIADAQDARGDLTQVDAGNPVGATSEAAEDEGPMQRNVPHSDNDVEESSTALGFPAETPQPQRPVTDPASRENTPESRVFRPRPRRHGRATPV